MKSPLLPCLIGLLLFSQNASAQYGLVRTGQSHVEPPWVAYVSSSKAYVWSEAGWTNADCEDIPSDDPLDRKKSKSERKKDTKEQADRHKQAADSCNNRSPEHLLEETQVIKVLTKEVHNPNGRVTTEPIHEEHDVFRFGRKEKLRFYKVRLETNSEDGLKQTYDGWVAADQVTTPEPKEIPPLSQASNCTECSTVGQAVTDGIPSMSKEIATKSSFLEIPRHVNGFEIKMKSEEDLAMFTCLHRGNKRVQGPPDSPKETDDFFKLFPDFVEAAGLAEKAFGVPKELVRCSMLAESGLRKDARSDRGAASYSQVMPETMAHLQELVKKSPYQEMWNDYKASIAKSTTLSEKRTEMTNLLVRVQNNIPSSTAAMALYYRWLHDNYANPTAKTSTCKNCATNCVTDSREAKRKDIDIMLIGYNWGPKGTGLFGPKAPIDILNDPRLPKQTKDHINKIENCLRKGWDTSFTEPSAAIDSTNKAREQKIQALKKQTGSATNDATQDKIQTLQNMITIRANNSYEQRMNDCNERSKNNWQSTSTSTPVRREASDGTSQK